MTLTRCDLYGNTAPDPAATISVFSGLLTMSSTWVHSNTGRGLNAYMGEVRIENKTNFFENTAESVVLVSGTSGGPSNAKAHIS